jgi:hypothetical protein
MSDEQVAALEAIGPAESDGNPEGTHWAALHNLYTRSPVAGNDQIKNLGLWHPAPYTARLVTFADLYRRYIVDTHGTVIQFGVRYGQDLIWLIQLRSLLEPWSYRPIIGFDTFTGHAGTTPEIDGDDWMVQEDAFGVPEHYEGYLQHLVDIHSNMGRLAGRIGAAPVGLFKGDVRDTLPALLEDDLKSLVVGAAFFDLDLYAPTVAALEAILPRCHAGTLLVFDELDANRMPGETRAVLDTVGLRGLRLERSPWDSMSWTTLDR